MPNEPGAGQNYPVIIAALQQENERLNRAAHVSRTIIDSLRTELQQARTQFRCFHCGKWVSEAEATNHFGDDEGERAICFEWAAATEPERRELYEQAERGIRVAQDAQHELEQQLDEAVGLLERCQPLFFHLLPDHKAPKLAGELTAFLAAQRKETS
jgi:hypothetical protein